LPFLLLLQQLAVHQPHDRSVVGKDAHHVGAAFDLLVKPLKRVDAPDIAPVLLGKVQEGQHVVSGGVHHGHSCWELLAQHLGDSLPVGAHLLRCLDHEHGLHGRCHHVLTGFGHMAEHVVREVHPAARCQLRRRARCPHCIFKAATRLRVVHQ
jgi:hypothetical protein